MTTLDSTISLTRTRKSLVAIDRGATGTRMVQIKHAGKDHYIQRVACSERPARSFSAKPWQALFREQLSTCKEQDDFRGGSATVALSGPDVQYHTLALPKAVLAEAGSADDVVRWELERQSPEQASSKEARFWHLPDRYSDQKEVIAVTADRSLILDTVEACSGVGLSCVEIESQATAMARLGVALARIPSSHVWGVLDVGFRECRLTLCIDETPLLVRLMGVGSSQWTGHVAEGLGISVSAAEVLKREHGIEVSERRDIPGKEDPVGTGRIGAMIRSLLRSDLGGLTTELKRSYEYILSYRQDLEAGDLILVGGGSFLPGLTEYLGDKLGIPVRHAAEYLGSPLCRLHGSSIDDETLGRCALAIGAAL